MTSRKLDIVREHPDFDEGLLVSGLGSWTSEGLVLHCRDFLSDENHSVGILLLLKLCLASYSLEEKEEALR